MKIGPLIYIEWVDAATNSGWFTHEETREWINKDNWLVRQVGWILEENEKHIILAGRIEIDDTSLLGQLCKIPKPWIVRRKIIKL